MAAGGRASTGFLIFLHMPKGSGDKKAQAVFTSGSFQAGGCVGVCLDIDPGAAKPGFTRPLGFIDYSIAYPGWKGPCCIRVQ
jgi:hypothetical protein